MELDNIYNALLELKGYKQMFGVNYNDSILVGTFENKEKLFTMNEVEVLLQDLDKFQRQEKAKTLNTKTFFKESILTQFPFHLFWKNNKREYQGCNLNYARFLKLDDPSQIYGKTDKNFFSNKDIIKDLKELEVKTLSTYTQSYERINHQDEEKELRLVHAYRIPILGKDGSCLGLLGIDFPHEKNIVLPNKLKEQNQALTALLDNSNNCFFSLAPNGNIRFANKKAKRIFNLPSQLEKIDFKSLLTNANDNPSISNFNEVLGNISEGEETTTQLWLKTVNEGDKVFDVRFNSVNKEILIEISEVCNRYSNLFKISRQNNSETKKYIRRVVNFKAVTSPVHFKTTQAQIDDLFFTENIFKLEKSILEYNDYLEINDSILHAKEHDLNELLLLAKEDLDTNEPGHNIDLQKDILPTVKVSAKVFINFFKRIIKIGFILCNKKGKVPIHVKVVENETFYHFNIDCISKQHKTLEELSSQDDPKIHSSGINLSLNICQAIISKHGGKMIYEWRGDKLFTIRFSLPKEQ